MPHLHRPEPSRIVDVAAAVSPSTTAGEVGDTGVEMMLGEPVAGAAEPFGLLGEVDAVA